MEKEARFRDLEEQRELNWKRMVYFSFFWTYLEVSNSNYSVVNSDPAAPCMQATSYFFVYYEVGKAKN